MKTLSIIAALLIAAPAFAGTRDNDDTCDIKVGPAATLLLPYFEVDVNGNSGQTTLFTITNVTRYPQIAHVTLWTDAAYPVLTFNLFLTGYDVQSINLADVLLRNVVAPPGGTSGSTTPGPLSSANSPNLRVSLECGEDQGLVSESLMANVRSALTKGDTGESSSCKGIGNVHSNAIGYATVDVVASCTTRMPNDPLYYANDILFDNVLIGDYQQLGSHPAGEPSAASDATANTMVHIRAVPEGGTAGSYVPTQLPFTFYDRYTPATSRTRDRRQPLPSTFAAHYVEGGPASFRTNLNIWRESYGIGNCFDGASGRNIETSELARFDEHENATVLGRGVNCSPGCYPVPIYFPAAFSMSTSDGFVFPSFRTADVAGWFYLALDNDGKSRLSGSIRYSVTHDVGGQPAPTIGVTKLGVPRPSQNWVTVTMFGNLAGNRVIEFDAAALGSGCSPAPFLSTATVPGYEGYGIEPIAPRGGVFVCPPGTTLTNGTTTDCKGTNVNPTP